MYCFSGTVVELSIGDGDNVLYKAKLFAIWLFKEKKLSGQMPF